MRDKFIMKTKPEKRNTGRIFCLLVLLADVLRSRLLKN